MRDQTCKKGCSGLTEGIKGRRVMIQAKRRR